MVEFLKHPIKHQTFIQAEPEKVFDTVTSGEGWNAFFTDSTEIDLKPGGKMVWRWKDWGPDFYNGMADAKVIMVLRPFQFAFEWYPVGNDTPTTITFNIKKEFGGTVVRLTEEGYPDTEAGHEMILECASGWAEALTLLKFYIEHGIIYIQPQR